MTWQERPDDADGDVDATGVRALLAGLPDPGPMPDELAAEIVSRLTDEAPGALGRGGPGLGERDAAAADAAMAGGEGLGGWGLGEVVTLDPDHRGGAARARRSRWLAMGAAAAAMVAVAVAGTALIQGTQTQPTTAAVPGRAGAVSGTQAEAGAAGASGSQLKSSGTAYTSATLARVAQNLLDQPVNGATDLGLPSGRATSPPPTLKATSSGAAPTGLPILAPGALTACLQTLGEDDADQVVADLATLDAAPAVIIVSVRGGRKQVYAVAPGCAHGDPMIIVGPVPMT